MYAIAFVTYGRNGWRESSGRGGSSSTEISAASVRPKEERRNICVHARVIYLAVGPGGCQLTVEKTKPVDHVRFSCMHGIPTECVWGKHLSWGSAMLASSILVITQRTFVQKCFLDVYVAV